MFVFFQAEDGIRDVAVTGVQTCALPIFFCVNCCARWNRQPSFRQAWLARREKTHPAPLPAAATKPGALPSEGSCASIGSCRVIVDCLTGLCRTDKPSASGRHPAGEEP